VPYSLYLHIPFCRHRCAYCDFNTYAGQDELIPAYVDALCKELAFVGSQLPSPSRGGSLDEGSVHTVFFGGGTPSLLSAQQFEAILLAICEGFQLTPEAEITLEANPGTVSQDYLRDLHTVGLNRLSFGVQSANPGELCMLERQHDFFDVIEAVTWARRAGFDNLNLDLIFGLPEQRLSRWQATVKLALGLASEHFSLYALTLEHGTPFGRWSARGLMPSPDPDEAAEMYEWADETLGAAGYEQYEISNWAKPGRQCQHNLQYWRGQPYLGFGAGAHGYANGYRYSNALRIKTYIERVNGKREPGVRNREAPGSPITASASPAFYFPLSPATVNHHRQTVRDDMSEFMMTGLRLTDEGVSERVFRQRFGRDMRDVFGAEIDELIAFGLLEWAAGSLHLTKGGRLLGNQAFLRFVGS
jgi:oxygen-independent coproporphyrinogen-3 oxidase